MHTLLIASVAVVGVGLAFVGFGMVIAAVSAAVTIGQD